MLITLLCSSMMMTCFLMIKYLISVGRAQRIKILYIHNNKIRQRIRLNEKKELIHPSWDPPWRGFLPQNRACSPHKNQELVLNLNTLDLFPCPPSALIKDRIYLNLLPIQLKKSIQVRHYCKDVEKVQYLEKSAT